MTVISEPDGLFFANRLATGPDAIYQAGPEPSAMAWFFTDWASAVRASIAGMPNCFSPDLSEGEPSFPDLLGDAAFFEQFPFVGIIPTQRPGEQGEIVELFRARVTAVPLLVLDADRLGKHKSAADYYDSLGGKALVKLLYDAKELPAYGLLNIADVKRLDRKNQPKVMTGIRELDRATGGLLMGDVSIWTGKRGEGKSTLISQLLIEAVDSGRKVCAYSGELAADRFKDWLYLQAAGPHNIDSELDGYSGKEVHTVNPFVFEKINRWMDKKLFLYDLGISSAHDADSIIKVFEYASKRYGCTVFLVDNIMTCRFKGANEANFYREQSNFVGRLVEFAIRYKAHVHLVAHPRKGDIKDGDDVSGISDITNRAGNVFSLSRVPEDKQEDFDAGLSILKNREYGEKVKIKLCFEPRSRRFYKAGTGNPNRRYGWEAPGKQEDFEEISGEGDIFT